MSIVIDPTVPPATENVSNGYLRIQAVAAWILQLIGQASTTPFTIAAAPWTVDANGNTTVNPGLNLTLAQDPTTGLHAATKQYVDSRAQGLGLYTGVATGTNTYAVTLSPVPANLAALQGYPVFVKIPNANTGASTLNPNGLGAIPIKVNGDALPSGLLTANQYYVFVYDGTNFDLQLLAPYVGGGYAKAANNSLVTPTFAVWTTVVSMSVTAPAIPAAAKYRLMAMYSLIAQQGSGSAGIAMQVTDGTNAWAGANMYTSAQITPAMSIAYSEVSPVTYAAGTSKTLTLQAQLLNGNPYIGVNNAFLTAYFVPGV